MTTALQAALEATSDDLDPSQPPHSPQAEEAVLGSILKDGHAIAEVAPFLQPEHFYVPC